MSSLGRQNAVREHNGTPPVANLTYPRGADGH